MSTQKKITIAAQITEAGGLTEDFIAEFFPSHAALVIKAPDGKILPNANTERRIFESIEELKQRDVKAKPTKLRIFEIQPPFAFGTNAVVSEIKGITDEWKGLTCDYLPLDKGSQAFFEALL
jgi:hypothetical protein